MTVPIQPTNITHVANGVSATFTFPFKCLLADDLHVELDGAIALPGSYTIAGLGQSSGSITFSTIPAAGAVVYIALQVAPMRTTSYPRGGNWNSDVVNADFDRLWLAIQTAYSGSRSALSAPSPEILLPMPPSAERAGKAVAFDETGNRPVMIPTDLPAVVGMLERAEEAAVESEEARDGAVLAAGEAGLAETAAQGHANAAQLSEGSAALSANESDVARIAAEAARDAAVSAGSWTYAVNTDTDLEDLTPAEGDTAYVRDTMHVWEYDGVDWVDTGESPLSAKEDKTVAAPLPQNIRTADFLSRRGFVAGELRGPELASGGGTTLAHNVVNGELEVGAGSDTLARYFWTGLTRAPGEAMEVEIAVRRTHDDALIRIMFGVGMGGATRQYITSSTGGGLFVANSSNTNIDQRNGLTAFNMNLALGQTMTLTLRCDENGDGWLIARHENGNTSAMPVSAVPTGPIRVGWRSTTQGVISSIVKRTYTPPRAVARSVIDERSPNALPHDLLSPFTLKPGTDWSDGWSSQHDGAVTFVERAGRYAARIYRLEGPTSFRVGVPVPSGATHMTAHIVLDDVIETNALTADMRLDVVQRVGASIVGTDTSYLQSFPAGEPFEKSIELLPDVSNIIFRINVGADLPAVISHASLAFDTVSGFRPARSPARGEDAPLVGWSILPLLPGRPSGAPQGWTCTGLSRIESGSWAGLFIVADDGRISEPSPGPYDPGFHVVDGDFRNIVATIKGDWNASAQGIAWNSLKNSVLVAASADMTVRSFDLYAAGSPQIPGDLIDLVNDLGITSGGNANALAFDPSKGSGGHLYLGLSDSRICYEVDFEAKTVVRTFTVGETPDHFCLLSDGIRLLYTVNTPNGYTGRVRIYNLINGYDALVCYMPRVEAPEGLFLNESKNELIAVSDGGFHVNAKPPLNLAARFRLPRLPAA